MLGKIEGNRRRVQQRMRWLDSITDSKEMNLSKFQETAEDRGDWHAAVHGTAKSWTWLSYWTTTIIQSIFDPNRKHFSSFCDLRKNLFSQVIDSLCLYACSALHLCLTLCDTMDYSLPGSSVHGILQARILEWIVMPSSRGSSWCRVWIWISHVSCTALGFFAPEPPGKTW